MEPIPKVRQKLLKYKEPKKKRSILIESVDNYKNKLSLVKERKPKKIRISLSESIDNYKVKLSLAKAIVDKIAWTPNPGSQTLFLSCPFKEVLYEGTRGCGKTDALIVDFIQHVGKGFGANWRGLLFRESFPQLKDVIAKSIKIIKRAFPDAQYNKTDHVWVFPEGEQLFFTYMKNESDYWNYHGHEYPWIGWEELCNWPDNSCYEIMRSCNRSSYPGMPRRYVSTTNPYGVGHGWVKQYFIDPAPSCTPIYNKQGEVRLRVTGYYWECKQLAANDPDYLNILLGITDPNLRKAWLEGSWDIVAGGAIVDVWSPSIHVIPPFVIPDSWTIDRSLDWGSTHPFSVGWWAQSDGTDVEVRGVNRSYPRGTIFHIAELYGWNGEPNKGNRMLSVEVARRIKEIESRWDFYVEPGPADNDIFTIRDGKSMAVEMKLAANIQWKDTADKRKGSRVIGLEKVRQMLSASKQFPMEDPGLFIFNTNSHWLRTVPSLPRDEDDMDDVDCFVAGTLISTDKGNIPVEKIREGDFVNTPIGLKKVLKSGKAGDDYITTVKLNNGTELTGTNDHKIYVQGEGLVSLCKIKENQELLQEDELCQFQKRNSRRSSLESTQVEGILNVVKQVQKSLGPACYIGLFGKILMDLYQKDMIYITKKEKKSVLKIMNCYIRAFMGDYILKKDLKKVGISKRYLMLGEKVTKEKRFFEKILRSAVKDLPLENLRALIVASLLQQNIHQRNFVVSNVKKQCQVMKKFVLYVRKFFMQSFIVTKRKKHVVTSVVGNLEEKVPVYYLTVDQAHLFYANGYLSANTDAEDHCYDMTRYRLVQKDRGARYINLQGV